MPYTPRHFRASDDRALREFVHAHDFATIVSTSREGPIASHIPILARSAGDALTIVGHFARANSHWQLMDGATAALVIFHGPHGYVSPTWYETGPAVPTWNYGVVHARGFPTATEDEAFARGVLDDLVRRYEGSRPNGWRPDQVPRDFYDCLVRGIVAFSMPVATLEGTFKLGQNRSVEDRRRTITALAKDGSPQAALLADFMRQYAGV